jgi:hypothetical protein
MNPVDFPTGQIFLKNEKIMRFGFLSVFGVTILFVLKKMVDAKRCVDPA